MSKRNRSASRNRPKPSVRPEPTPRRIRGRHLAYATLGLLVAIAVWFGTPDSPLPGTLAPEAIRQIRFEDPGTGVDFVLDNGTVDEKPMPDSTLGGVAVLDCDNDGLLDIYFANGARFPDFEKADESFHNRLYRNLGDRQFEDITRQSRVEGAGYNMGLAAGDYDNDGGIDLFVAGVDRNILYHNDGDCRFSDVTQRAGLGGSSNQRWSVAAAWLDYDNDGKLDLFVVNYLDWSWNTNRVCGDPGRRLSCSPAYYEGLPNALYRNVGDGTFDDVSRESGIADHVGKGMSAGVADYDGDGFMDILITNDSVRNFLFHNLQGERFEEVGVQSGIAFIADGIPVSSMGLDFRDLNGDGLPDAVITALANETYPLFLNSGDGVFSDATYRTGIGLASFRMSGWSVAAIDFDNDGVREVFTANSHVSENIESYRDQAYRLPNAIFQKAADGTYRDVAPQAGPALARIEAHRGAAFGDLDNDGRVDVVVSAIGAEAAVLFNQSEAGQWLTLDLQGTASNRSGIGARVELTHASGRKQYSHATTAVGYASSSDKRLHFGIGDDRTIRQVEIRWPSGKLQSLEDVSSGQVLAVTEPE